MYLQYEIKTLNPYATFFMNTLDTAEARRGMIQFQNVVQPSNDGMFLEAVLSSCVCLASHSNGFSGVTLQQFLSDLIYQIQTNNQTPVSVINFKGLEFMKDFNVPFLSPPNQNWPDWLYHESLSKLNCKFGNLTRTLNKDKIDLITDCGISGESKDYGNVLKIDKMKGILQRIPKNSKLHIVFVRKLQDSYFTRKEDTFQKLYASLPAKNRVYFKISASQNPPSLEAIKGLPSILNEPAGAVVFVLVTNNLKYIR
jgi:hypothetical protein